MSTASAHLRVPVDAHTRIELRRIDGQPLALSIHSGGGLVIDLVLVEGTVADITAAGVLEDAGRRLLAEARSRAGKAVAS